MPRCLVSCSWGSCRRHHYTSTPPAHIVLLHKYLHSLAVSDYYFTFHHPQHSTPHPTQMSATTAQPTAPQDQWELVGLSPADANAGNNPATHVHPGLMRRLSEGVAETLNVPVADAMVDLWRIIKVSTTTARIGVPEVLGLTGRATVPRRTTRCVSTRRRRERGNCIYIERESDDHRRVKKACSIFRVSCTSQRRLSAEMVSSSRATL